MRNRMTHYIVPRPVFFIIIFFACLLLLPEKCFCRSKTDSISRLISKEKEPSEKYALYLERARSYGRKDSTAAFKDIAAAEAYYREVHHSKGLVNAGLARADVYYNMKAYQQSAAESLKALKLAQNAGYKKGEALAAGRLGWCRFYLKDLNGAQKSLRQAITVEEQLKPQEAERLIELYGLLGTIETKQGRYNESLEALENAIRLGQELSTKQPLIRIYANYAHSLDITSQTDKALRNHLMAIKIAESYRDTVWLMREYNNIAIVYKNLKEYDKAIAYYEQSLRISSEKADYKSMGLSIMNIAIVKDAQDQPEKNDSLFRRAIDCFRQAHDLYGQALAYHNYGNLLVSLRRYKEAEQHLLKALKLRQDLGLIPLQASTLSVLGKLTIAQKRWEAAENYLNLAEKIYGGSDDNNRILRDLYLYKKQLYAGKGDFRKAYNYQAKEMAFDRKLYDESEKVNALKLQAEYELEKRDRQIEAERMAHWHRQIYLFGISGFILLILALFVIVLLQRRKRVKERHQAELLQLEQQHRLSLAGSLAKAEHEERKKIANRLHDETNGILSVARLNLDQLEENMHTAARDADEQLKAIKKLLAEASDSIRGISHSLMPVTLEKYGLKAALQELTAAINTAGKIKIEQVIEGLDHTQSWNPQLCLTIYRMAQEAFSNIIKHARATHVLFQVVELKDSVTIYIEDNGNGTSNTLSENNGIGLTLLKQNIEYLNGKIEFNSKENKGTFILAELPIRQNSGF